MVQTGKDGEKLMVYSKSATKLDEKKGLISKPANSMFLNVISLIRIPYIKAGVRREKE